MSLSYFIFSQFMVLLDYSIEIYLNIQENIPNATAEKVTNDMLEGVESALGLSKGSLEKPFYARVQLWFALPLPVLLQLYKIHG